MPAQISRRRNGFSTPYSKAQISAWVAFVATFLEFLFFVSPIMPLAASIPVTIFFTILVLGVVYYGGLTTSVDPVDIYLAKELRESDNEEDKSYFGKNSGFFQRMATRRNPQTEIPDEEPMKQCWICDVQVAEHSMHCKFCNKCVYHFDHHCMWLNTCIGSANYKFFFRTMLFIFAMEISHFIIQLVLVIDSFLGGPTEKRMSDWFQANLPELVQAVLIFFIIFSGISVLMIGQLLWFHVGLQRENISTYQYIVQDHKKKREKMKLEDELTNQRIVAVAKAYREGKNLKGLRLRMGGWCRKAGCTVCDPMKLPDPPREPDPEAGFAGALGRSPSRASSDDDVMVGEERPLPQQNEQAANTATTQGNMGEDEIRRCMASDGDSTDE